jgi:broad specificity phosphatase PhoE
MRCMLVFLLSMLAFAALADDQLWGRLQRDPNMVALMRNAESTGNQDGASMLVWDVSGNCAGESTLTEEGKAHAKRIGDAFAEHGIRPVVISSPMCRCSETSRIAFGEYLADPDLRQSASGDIQGQEQFQARARALLGEYRGKAPIVFVNHRPNIDSLTMELINIGDLLVGRVSTTGEIEVLGTIRIEMPGANGTGTGKAE